jgi:hypothetical protein
MFTGNNHVTFPQWRKEALAILGSSGTLKEFWHTTILKRVGAPAMQKITQEAISDKSVDKIMRDLNRHFNRSDVVISLLTNLHTQAGPIPDPKLEPYSCYKVLTTHSEILTGVAEFIKSSDCPNRLTNLYNPYVCKELFKLIPQSVHFENPTFRTSQESASMDYKSKYTAWEQWVASTLQSLTEMDADSRAGAVTPLSATPTVHPVLVASNQPTHLQEDTITRSDYNILVTKIEKMEAKRPSVEANHPSVDGLRHQERPLTDGFTAELPTTCRFCTILSKSSITDTSTYNNIKVLPFNTRHKPYKSRHSHGYKINPDNCLQWLNTSVTNRILVLESSTARQVCHICLNIPTSWNRGQTGCDAVTAPMR